MLRNGSTAEVVSHEIAPQCLPDLNRLTVEGMAAQIPQIGVLPAQRWVQANFGDLEGGGAIGDRCVAVGH